MVTKTAEAHPSSVRLITFCADLTPNSSSDLATLNANDVHPKNSTWWSYDAAELPCHGSRKCQHDECAFYYETVLSDRRGAGKGGAKWGGRFLSTRICAYFCGCFQRRSSVRGCNHFCQLSKHSTTERVRTPPADAPAAADGAAACSRFDGRATVVPVSPRSAPPRH